MMVLNGKTVEMDESTQVRELMTKDVITVQNDDKITKVVEVLDANPIHHVVVLSQGKVAGVISKNDMIRLHHTVTQSETGQGHVATTAADIMTSNPMVVEPDDTLGLVADIILANRFHSLPVVEDGELVGIITSHDLIKFCFK